MHENRPAVLTIAALASLAASAAGAAPYPASGLIAGIAWDTATYQAGGLGGDLWPVTAGADGRVYTAWGDGTVTCPVRVSYGVASVAGGPSAALRRVGCGTPGDNAGKLISLLDVASTLFAVAYLQGRPDTGAIAVWSSPDHGRTWRQPGPTFRGTAGALQPNSFVNFGPGYAGARDGYVYLTATEAGTAPRAFYLMRVARAGLGGASYEYFTGTAAAPAWGAAPGAAKPVFVDPSGVNGQDVVYDAGLGRYLVTAAHGADGSDGGKLGVFEGPAPWGPWRTVEYEERWLGIPGGSFLGLHFPSPWMAAGGGTLWGVFSCYSRTGACGRYPDRYNLMRATLTVRRGLP